MSEESRREEIRTLVGRVYEESVARKFWQGIGRAISFFPGLRRKVIPLWVSSFVVIAASVLVCFLAAWLAGAHEFFSRGNLNYVFIVSAWLWFSIAIAERQIQKSLASIETQAVGLLELPKGEADAMVWVRLVTSRRNQVMAAILAVLAACVLMSFALRLDLSQPLGWIKSLHLFLGLAWWAFHLTWIGALLIFFGFTFCRWPLRLFQDDPASTLPLLALHRSAGQLLLVSALIAALAIPVGILLNALTSLSSAISVVAIWIPLLVFYIATERCFSAHIRAAKSDRLAGLQQQIASLERQAQTPDVKTAELIQRLLEIHEKVRRAPNSLVNLNSLLNLFGSLALPLLGALVKLYEIGKQLLGIP